MKEEKEVVMKSLREGTVATGVPSITEEVERSITKEADEKGADVKEDETKWGIQVEYPTCGGISTATIRRRRRGS